MEYHLNFKDTDIRTEIRGRLEKSFPALTSTQLDGLVEFALEEIRNQGNDAPYQGLLMYGTKIALDKLRETKR